MGIIWVTWMVYYTYDYNEGLRNIVIAMIEIFAQ
jgi:hypothetical protein